MKKKRVLIVCHDAGGAEIISSWAKKNNSFDFDFLLEGPALSVFQRKFESLVVLNKETAFANISRYDLVATGTSWISNLDNWAIQRARNEKVHSVTYLDHWVEYKERFFLEQKLVLPDEIWVGDQYGLELAKKAFPDFPIQLEPNLYFEEMVDEIDRLSPKSRVSSVGVRILYVTEPKPADLKKKDGGSRCWGYTEIDALEGYLKYLENEETEIEAIRIRPHPVELVEKYVNVTLPFKELLNIQIGKKNTLTEDCAWAHWVVGCDSMAMVIGVLAGKKVFSSIPPEGKPTCLPHSKIIPLFGTGQ